MARANRMIAWGALLTIVLVGTCVAAPFVLFNPDHGRFGTAVIVAYSIMAAYFLAGLGMITVLYGTISNWVLRRSNPELETKSNRKPFYLGLTFCVVLGSFLLLSILG